MGLVGLNISGAAKDGKGKVNVAAISRGNEPPGTLDRRCGEQPCSAGDTDRPVTRCLQPRFTPAALPGAFAATPAL